MLGFETSILSSSAENVLQGKSLVDGVAAARKRKTKSRNGCARCKSKRVSAASTVIAGLILPCPAVRKSTSRLANIATVEMRRNCTLMSPV
jgi:hypothetical protein